MELTARGYMQAMSREKSKVPMKEKLIPKKKSRSISWSLGEFCRKTAFFQHNKTLNNQLKIFPIFWHSEGLTNGQKEFKKTKKKEEKKRRAENKKLLLPQSALGLNSSSCIFM